MSTRTRADEALHELFLAGASDPFPLYDELRETGDGFHFLEPFGAYTVLRYEDLLAVMRDPELFSSDIFWESPPGLHDPDDAQHRRYVDISSRQFMFHDPPRHTRIRRVVRQAFVPRVVNRWKPAIERASDELMERFEPGQEIDFGHDLALHVPVAVITEILGIPAEDRGQFHDWSFAFASTFDPMIQGEARDRAIRGGLEMFDYLAEIVADRHRNPRDDLSSIVVQARDDDGEPLEDAEIIAQLALILAAGNETTTNLLTNTVSILIDRPELQQHIAGTPSSIPGLVEESLRFDPPLHASLRKATRATRVGATDVPEGATLLCIWPAGNRDPRRFDQPQEFRLDRPDNKHLAFAHGIHFCVGAPLARLEGNVILGRLMQRFPQFRAGSEPPVRRTTNIILRGWESRPVVLDADLTVGGR
jgi:cytochrome P450